MNTTAAALKVAQKLLPNNFGKPNIANSRTDILYNDYISGVMDAYVDTLNVDGRKLGKLVDGYAEIIKTLKDKYRYDTSKMMFKKEPFKKNDLAPQIININGTTVYVNEISEGYT